MRKDLDIGGLIYYSNKLKAYLSSKFSKVQNDIDSLVLKVDLDNTELQNKINDNTVFINKNTGDIQTTNTNITGLENKYDELKTEIDNKSIEGIEQVVNYNNVDYYVFKSILAGETVEIPNSGDSCDFIIDCYTQVNDGPAVIRSVIDLTLSNAANIEYDNRYTTLTDTGFKPREEVMVKFNPYYTDSNMIIYVSDLLPEYLQDSIDNITFIEEVTS